MLSACSVHWNAVEKRLVITPLFFDPAHAHQQTVAAAYLGDEPSDADNLVFEGGLVKEGRGASYYNYKRCPGTEDALEPFQYDAPIPSPTPDDPNHMTEYAPLTYEQIMPRVFRLAIYKLFDCNPGILDRSKPTIILVGRPSSSHWTQNEAAYAKLLKENLSIHGCTQDVHVLIQSESTAALARHTDPFWHDAITRDEYVIVIDCGSSTFDVTLITPMGIPENGEDSRQFGGNLLNANFLRLLKASVPEGWSFETPHGTKLVLRTKKEAFYGPFGTSCEDQIIKVPIVHASHERKNHRFEIDEDCVHTAVEQTPVTYFEYVESAAGFSLPKRVDCGSWLDGVRKIFGEFHDKLAPLLPHGHARFDRVILSRGVSIMPEVQQAVSEVFGVKPMVSDSLNFSVAEGLAYVLGVEARKQALITQLREKMEELFPTSWDSTHALRSAIADAGSAEDWEIVHDSLKNWANAQGSLTQDDWRQKYFAPLFTQRAAQNLGSNVIDGTTAWYRKYQVEEKLQKLLRGTPAPKGVLLVGVPGTGKTLMARETARRLGPKPGQALPLIRFDISRLQSKDFGTSEANLNRFLDQIGAYAPAVMLVDEIEKTFHSNDQGEGMHEVKTQMLGTLLDWLQGRRDNIFTFITANNISSVPPELLRDERLSGRFFSFMPSRDELTAILCLKLNGYRHLFTKDFAALLQGVVEEERAAPAVARVFDDIALSAQKAVPPRYPFMTGANLTALIERTFRSLRKDRKNPPFNQDTFLKKLHDCACDRRFVPQGQSNLKNIAALRLRAQENQYENVSTTDFLPTWVFSDGRFVGLASPASAYDQYMQQVIRKEIERQQQAKETDQKAREHIASQGKASPD